MLERSRVTQEFRCHVLLRQRSPSGSATPTGGFVPQSDETTLVESFQAEPTDLRGIYGAFDVDILLLFDLMTCHSLAPPHTYSHTPAQSCLSILDRLMLTKMAR